MAGPPASYRSLRTSRVTRMPIGSYMSRRVVWPISRPPGAARHGAAVATPNPCIATASACPSSGTASASARHTPSTRRPASGLLNQVLATIRVCTHTLRGAAIRATMRSPAKPASRDRRRAAARKRLRDLGIIKLGAPLLRYLRGWRLRAAPRDHAYGLVPASQWADATDQPASVPTQDRSTWPQRRCRAASRSRWRPAHGSMPMRRRWATAAR